MPHPDRDQRHDPASEDEDVSEESIEALFSMKNSFGTAVGAAMLGFEQALLREPQRPARGGLQAPRLLGPLG